MRTFAILVILLACKNGFTDTIQKWTDESGQVHYGDNPPAAIAANIEHLQLDNNFDPVAYEQAVERNSALYREINQIEKREAAEAKKAEKDLQKYFDQLDKKSREIKREKLKKRQSRELERNRTSIKIKRSSASKQPTASRYQSRQ